MKPIHVIILVLLGMLVGGIAGCEMGATPLHTSFSETSATGLFVDAGVVGVSTAASAAGGGLSGALVGGGLALLFSFALAAIDRRSNQRPQPPEEPADALWPCPQCKAANRNTSSVCASCGYRLF